MRVYTQANPPTDVIGYMCAELSKVWLTTVTERAFGFYCAVGDEYFQAISCAVSLTTSSQ